MFDTNMYDEGDGGGAGAFENKKPYDQLHNCALWAGRSITEGKNLLQTMHTIIEKISNGSVDHQHVQFCNK